MKEIKICDKKIGDGEPTFVIAEAGINHDGKLAQAKKLVQEAGNAGADAVKFQVFKAEEFCSKNSKYFGLFKALEFTTEEWIEIAELARGVGITFSASVFGENSADILEKIGSPMYKIASGDITYLSLLNYVAMKRTPIVLSTGMATIGDVEAAIQEIYRTGNKKVALLHCVSNYPTKHEEANLRVVQTLKDLFRVPVGFSDHTVGSLIPIAAAAIGANLVEKHFTLNRNLPGPDHKFSLEPSQFKEMVENIRTVERSLGDGVKRLTKGEEKLKKLARRSLVARIAVPKGSRITRNAVKIVRPGNGIDPKFLNVVMGRVARRDIGENEPITWDKI